MIENDPFVVFTQWFEQARAVEPSDHDAVALASVDEAGQPAIRMVLMRAYDARGFVFYTNLASAKSRDYRNNPLAAMCFHWKSTARQIRIEGPVAMVSPKEADAYFDSRPRESQIGAWASKQSEELPSRTELEQRFQDCSDRFGRQPIPRPEFWSGFRLAPRRFEFWDKRPYRLHDRVFYVREGDQWRSGRFYP